MKATGIVRRIDDLGRVVIPKEIRRTLRIRESDPLEIFTDREGEIILKKYSSIGELGSFAKEYVESLAQVSGYTACITDHDQIIAASGAGAKEYTGKRIHPELEEVINARKSARTNQDNIVKIAESDSGGYSAQAFSSIICAGDSIGSVVIFTKNEEKDFTETELKLTQAAAGFLGRQME